MVDDPGQEIPPAADPVQPARRGGQPLWTAFLTPLAVLLGAALVAGAIWVTDDDGSAPAATVQPDPDAVSSVDGASGTTPTTFLSALRSYATELELDAPAFEQCLGDEGKAEVINQHLARGSALGVTGTPTFFINNKMVVGAQPTAVFLEIIEKELDGGAMSVDEYSSAVQALAQTTPPRFAIIDKPVDVAGAPMEGNPDAEVMIAEFSDFQCPFCQRWVQATLGAVREQLGDDVALAFLHFPITQIHPNAGFASFAAICAGEQDKFWGMHDLLFARQAEWKDLPAN